MDPYVFFILFLIVFIFLGVVVLCSYGWYAWYHYIGNDSTKQSEIWSIWGGMPQFVLWCISATMSAIGFLCFSIWVLNNTAYIVNRNADWVIWPYVIFLISSAAYTYLLWMCTSKSDLKVIVIVDLFVVTVCTITLSVWVFLFTRRENAFELFIQICMLVLAFHCTLFDFVLWGVYWYTGCYYTIENSTGERVFVRPSSMKVSQFSQQWPMISSFDISRSTHHPPHRRLVV